MRERLDAARPLGEIVWEAERGSAPLDTPERRAALEQRLEARARGIADRTVAENYRRFFRDKLYQAFAGAGRGRRLPPRRPGERGPRGAGPTVLEVPPSLPDPRIVLQRRQEEILVATLINHPGLIHEFAEEFAAFEFSAPDLDKLRARILNIAALRPDLDAGTLKVHLCHDGFTRAVDGLLTPHVYAHARFARPDAEVVAARHGWIETWQGFHKQRQLAAEIDRAAGEHAAEMTESSLARLAALQRQRDSGEEDGAAEVAGDALH
jgi:DNA primase